MENMKLNLPIIFLVTLAVIVPVSLAHIGQWDEVWQTRAEDARKNYLESYYPEPEKITNSLIKAVHLSLNPFLGTEANNSTRRQLGKRYKGPCQATNPIDQCWRCDENWANHRKRLADCVLGFGRNARGGKDGEIYVVTDSSDDLVNPVPGSLRYGVIQEKPLWIIFKHDMVIRLNGELIMQSNKTIDGRGARIFIHGGAGFTIQFVKNIIIHGIHITNIVQGRPVLIRDGENHLSHRGSSDGDGISIFGASDIWIDHVSMRRCYDGLIDAIMGSTGITISNCHFTDHNDVMLFGAHDYDTPDSKMQITIAFNHFGKRLIQRMPRCRFGYFHVINNDYTHWEMYAIGGSKHPTVISHGNRYIAQNNTRLKEITHRNDATESEWKHWLWVSEGDLFLNGAFFVESGDDDPIWVKKHEELLGGLKAAPGENTALMTKFAGALECHVGVPC